jgi:hypothetical protein
MMISRTIRRLFSYWGWSHEDGTPVTASWIERGGWAVLYNPNSGVVIADMYDTGKYQTTVFVSPMKALRLLRQNTGFLVSLRTFPRFTFVLYDFTADSLSDAKAAVLEILGIDRL